MRIARPCALLLSMAATAFAGCVGSRLAAEAPSGLSLAGAWKLDHSASDDPQKLLERMRKEAFSRMARRVAAPPVRATTRGGAGPVVPPPEDQAPGADSTAAIGAPGARPDPLAHSPMAHVLHAYLARGDYLTVRESAGELVLDYGASQRRFTSGEHSVVSAEGGVADQSCGWKGREYVIEIRGQSSPDVIERYALSPDGHRLIEKLHIGAEELSAVDLTRVYVPTDETAPRQTLSND